MTPDLTRHLHECTRLSAAGEIHFGDLVARLVHLGVERYHADYTRCENTYYTPQGESCVVPMGCAVAAIRERFDADAVVAAIRQAQRGEIMYPQFTRQVLAAGCVGYFVQIRGRCVQYFGRGGEMHTEWFPGAGQ
ncbi:MAG: DUF1398 family protein [Phycisphaerales bacterium]